MWEYLLNLDGNLLLWIQENVRNELLTPIMIFITHLGDGGRCWIVLAALLLLIKKTRATGILMGISLCGSLIVNNLLLKNLVARIRPYEAVEGLHRMIEAQGDLSFPSGHTGSSFAAAMVIFPLWGKQAGLPALAAAFLVAISRLYVGVHYPTDVLAGMVTGTAIAFVVCKGFGRYKKSDIGEAAQKGEKKEEKKET